MLVDSPGRAGTEVALEDRLGARLLNRTTRKVNLTVSSKVLRNRYA